MRLIQGTSLSFTNLTDKMIGVNVGDWRYFKEGVIKTTNRRTDWEDFEYIKRR